MLKKCLKKKDVNNLFKFISKKRDMTFKQTLSSFVMVMYD